MDIKRPDSKQPIPEHAKKVFSGELFDVYQWEQPLYDGTTAIFEKLKRPDTVIVYPILPDGRILLTEQEQPGKRPFVGTAGGRVDKGEDILAAAKRELLEETGYEAGEWILWDARHPTGKIDWVVYTFVAKGLKKVADMDLDGGEKIELKPVLFDEFLAIASDLDFIEKETVPKVLEARLYPEKLEQLRKLFSA
ncbi:MAG: NUDIX hydrolase [Candidatus Paceibacterota bacterium]